MGPLLKLIRAHFQTFADQVIPYIVAEYERATAPRQTFAATKTIPLPDLDPLLKDRFTVMTGDMTPHMERAYRRRGLQVLKQFRVGAEVYHIVDHRAIAYARNHAGELIKDFARSTPEMLRETVTKALEENWSAGQLRDQLRDDYAFSPARALNISRTEIEESYRNGGRTAAKVAGAQYKIWRGAPDACSLCQMNIEAGKISIDDSWPAGDSPHPSCACDEEFSMEDLSETLS